MATRVPNLMVRPFAYRKIEHSIEDPDLILCGTPRLYGLVHDGEWLIQSRRAPYAGNTIHRYYRHIYSNIGQARVAAQKILDRYNIACDIKEIRTDDADFV